MTIEELQIIIKANIDEDTADVDAAIDLAIGFLSNFFYVRKVDVSQTVNTGDTSIPKPARSLRIDNLQIANDHIKKATMNKLQEIEDDNSQRWYIEDEFISDTDNKIHLTKSISSADNGGAVKIWYKASFTPLAGVALSETDLPERLEPLLVSFATYFYYGILVSQVKNNKANFPNMTVWDVIAIWDTWRVHSLDLLDEVKKQKFD